MAKPKKLGRPHSVKWEKADVLWKTHSNAQIAAELGTSYTNVFLKRKSLTKAAVAAGDPDKYVSTSKVRLARKKQSEVPAVEQP